MVPLLVILRLVCWVFTNVNQTEFIFFYLFNHSDFPARLLLTEATKYFSVKLAILFQKYKLV